MSVNEAQNSQRNNEEAKETFNDFENISIP